MTSITARVTTPSGTFDLADVDGPARHFTATVDADIKLEPADVCLVEYDGEEFKAKLTALDAADGDGRVAVTCKRVEWATTFDDQGDSLFDPTD